MTDTPIKLSATGRAMLTLAATREDRLVRPPQLPAAAARQVVRSLLNNGLAEEIPAPVQDAPYRWRTGDDGTVLMLRATAGLAAIGEAAAPKDEPPTIGAFTQQVIGFLAEDGCNATILDEAEAKTMVADGFANGRPAARVAGDILAWLAETEEEAEEATQAATAKALEAVPLAVARTSLGRAAEAVLAAWIDNTNGGMALIRALEGPMAALRTSLGRRTTRAATTGARPPRTGTKQAQVLTLLRRPEGATVAQMAEATGWQSHTVRGFLAGLKKKGIEVEALERVRQVGPNKRGDKGSYTVYRVAEAG